MKGGSIKMERRIILWIVIAVIFIAVLFLIFKVGVGEATGTAQSAGNAVSSAASSSSGMVGGC